MGTRRKAPPFDNRLKALNGVLRQRLEEDTGRTLTVQTVIFYGFFTVIEVNRSGCISYVHVLACSIRFHCIAGSRLLVLAF